MPKPTTKPLFSAPYTHTGVQRLIQWIMDSQGIGQFELSKRSGLSPATIFQILKKSEREVTRPPRRSSLTALAGVIGADVQFETRTGRFVVVQRYEIPPTESSEIDALLRDLGDWIMSRRKSLTREERQLILRVLKSLVD